MASAQKGKSRSTTRTKTSAKKKTANKRTTKQASRLESASGKRMVKSESVQQMSPREAALRIEIKLWICLAVSILLELSNFSLTGRLGKYLSRVMFGLFGIYAYIFPVALFVGFSFIVINISNGKAVKKFSASVIAFLMLCSATQIFVSGSNKINFYTICANEKSGGGLFGGLIGSALASVAGIYGAYIIIVFMLIICAIIITEKSFAHGIKKGYTTTKGNFHKIKEESEVYIENSRRNSRKKGDELQLINFTKQQDQELHEIHSNLPENSIYKGPVIGENINTNTGEIVETPEEERIVEHEIYNEQSSTNDNSQDENDVFTPREKIQVSKSARDEMSRKPFSNKNIHEGNSYKEPDVSTGVVTSADSSDNEKNSNSKTVLRYQFPPLNLLKKGTGRRTNTRKGLSETAIKLGQILKNFGVNVTVTNESRGPSVTRYELQPELGTKVSKITSLTDDIKLNLAAPDIRIEAPIPGKAAVGIEVPNDKREAVFLRDLIESDELKNHPSKLAFAAGMDIAGNVIVADIAKMPHMLIAGTTGSGKSVFTNSIIMSILFRADPMEVKMIIVDPKVVEFGVYNGIPHLLTPVVTDPRKAAGALAWAVNEMSDRYKKFADYNVRDLKGYNEKISKIKTAEGEEPLQKLPQILIIIDELADLMMVAAKEVESSICRLAQLARAAGIHLIIATQRPSVDVVTGLIKANIPSRVALLVSSGIDSRTIIDINGAEKLLGNGDMLFYPSGYIKPIRVQGAFVSDGEVQSVVDFIISHTEKIEYNEEITNQDISIESSESSDGNDNNQNDEYFAEAAKFVIQKGKASTSMLQRMYRIGFNRAARIMDQLCQAGVVGEEEGTKPRKVLMTIEEFELYLQNNN